MKYYKSIRNISFLCAVLPICICFLSVFFMNKQIPIHYDTNGVIDRYGSSYEFLIIGMLFSLFPFIMSIIFNILKISDYGKAIGLAGSILMSTTFTVLLGIFIARIFSVSKIVGINNIGRAFSFCSLSIGVLMLLVGSILSFLPQNHFIGIRTKVTLASNKIWKDIHIKGAIIFSICGLAIMVVCVIIQTIYSLLALVIGIAICISLICLLLQRYKIKGENK